MDKKKGGYACGKDLHVAGWNIPPKAPVSFRHIYRGATNQASVDNMVKTELLSRVRWLRLEGADRWVGTFEASTLTSTCTIPYV